MKVVKNANGSYAIRCTAQEFDALHLVFEMGYEAANTPKQRRDWSADVNRGLTAMARNKRHPLDVDIEKAPLPEEERKKRAEAFKKRMAA